VNPIGIIKSLCGHGRSVALRSVRHEEGGIYVRSARAPAGVPLYGAFGLRNACVSRFSLLLIPIELLLRSSSSCELCGGLFMPSTTDISHQQTPRGTAPGSDPEFHETSGLVSGGFAEVAEFYRQLGFDSGYARAAADQLEFSVTAAEQILREQADSENGPVDARRLLYALIARMDRRLSLFANVAASRCDATYMEGGLGI
jgi:hypothetical protein